MQIIFFYRKDLDTRFKNKHLQKCTIFLKKKLLKQILLIKSNSNLGTVKTVQSVKHFPYRKEDMGLNPKGHIKPGMKSSVYNQMFLCHCEILIWENMWNFKGQRTTQNRSVSNKVQHDGWHSACSLMATHTVAHVPTSDSHKGVCICPHIVIGNGCPCLNNLQITPQKGCGELHAQGSSSCQQLSDISGPGHFRKLLKPQGFAHMLGIDWYVPNHQLSCEYYEYLYSSWFKIRNAFK